MIMAADARKWITPQEAAAAFGCHLMTIYREAKRGHLPHKYLGKRLLIHRSAVEAVQMPDGTTERHSIKKRGRPRKH